MPVFLAFRKLSVKARLVRVTMYDLSLKKEKESYSLRSSGFSNQDFYTVPVLLLIFVSALIMKRKLIYKQPGSDTAHCRTSHATQWQQEALASVHLRLP